MFSSNALWILCIGSIWINYCVNFYGLLFQPIMKVPLGRDIWNVVDIIVAIFLIYLCLHNKGLKKMITTFFWINNIDFINEKGHS